VSQDIRLHLLLFWGVVKRRWPVMVLCALFASSLAFGGKRLKTPSYKAKAEVLVQDGGDVNPLLKDLIVPWQVKNRLPVIQGILRSRKTLTGVLMKLGRVKKSTSEPALDAELQRIRRSIEVFGRGGGVVQIAFTANSPKNAHRGLEVVVGAFMEEMLRPQKQAVVGSTDFLRHQLNRLRAELDDIEEKTTAYKTANAQELPEVFKVNLEAHLALRKGLTEAEVRLESALRRKKNLEDRLRLFNPLVQDLEKSLAAARAQLAEYLAVYTESHPDVVGSQNRIAGLEDRLVEARAQTQVLDETQLEKLMETTPLISLERPAFGSTEGGREAEVMTSDLLAYKLVRSEIEGIRGEIEMLTSRLGKSDETLRAHASNELVLKRLLRESEIKGKAYQSLLARYEDALVTRELAAFDEENQVWVLDPPSLPGQATGAKLGAVVAGGGVGGFFFALIIAVLLEFLSDVVRRPEDLKALDLPHWGDTSFGGRDRS
jgi:uncharacterized protein involved in exopolysaccharide biosynthesis